MKDDPEYARLAAEVLARRPIEVRPRPAQRDHGIAIIGQAILAARHQRQRALWLRRGGFAAAALALVAGAGWAGHQHGVLSASVEGECAEGATCSQAQVRDSGQVAGRPFEPGQSIVAGRGATSVVEFASGTRISLEEQGELEYRDGQSARRFGLLRGSAHLRVQKLNAGERFVVETPDSEVEVRGTAFTVSVKEPGQLCASSRTRVLVDEGVVEVRFKGVGRLLKAGERWPTGCDEERASRAAPPVASEDARSEEIKLWDLSQLQVSEPSPRAPVASTQGAGRRPSQRLGASAASTAKSVAAALPAASASPEPVVSSPLAEQNDLYARAVEARRLGHLQDALELFEQLTLRFPDGPLGESAAVERIRLLRARDPARARAEAQRYLTRYPRGFGRKEARAALHAP